MLGHDEPLYEVDKAFLQQPGLWIHCKNHEAMPAMSLLTVNYFWHQEDDITLTSWGYMWTYPGKPLFARSIAVMPEWNMDLDAAARLTCLGICSDYVARIAELRSR